MIDKDILMIDIDTYMIVVDTQMIDIDKVFSLLQFIRRSGPVALSPRACELHDILRCLVGFDQRQVRLAYGYYRDLVLKQIRLDQIIFSIRVLRGNVMIVVRDDVIIVGSGGDDNDDDDDDSSGCDDDDDSSGGCDDDGLY